MKTYSQKKQLILDTLLTGKSTTALSKKLGYSFDKVKRWKTGSKQLHWNEFCDLCLLLKLPLQEAMASSLGILFDRKNDYYRIVPHLKVFLGNRSTAVLAKQMKVSTSALQRHLSLKSFPELEFVFKMIDQRPHFLDNFLDSLLMSKEVSSTKKSMISIPWTAAVANAASLKAHSSLPAFSKTWLANFLGLSEEQVDEAIELMLQLKLIEKKGSHYGPTLSRTIAVSSAIDKNDYSQFIRYWMRRAEHRFATKSGVPINKNESPNKDGFRIFSASAKSVQKISEILVTAEQEIHELLQQDTDEKTDVRVLLLHHFSAQDF